MLVVTGTWIRNWISWYLTDVNENQHRGDIESIQRKKEPALLYCQWQICNLEELSATICYSLI